MNFVEKRLQIAGAMKFLAGWSKSYLENQEGFIGDEFWDSIELVVEKGLSLRKSSVISLPAGTFNKENKKSYGLTDTGLSVEIEEGSEKKRKKEEGCEDFCGLFRIKRVCGFQSSLDFFFPFLRKFQVIRFSLARYNYGNINKAEDGEIIPVYNIVLDKKSEFVAFGPSERIVSENSYADCSHSLITEPSDKEIKIFVNVGFC